MCANHRLMPWVRFIIAFIIVLNAPFWIAPRFLDTAPRGWINVEYIAAAILLLFVRRWVCGIVLGLGLLADTFHSSISFFFFTQHDVLHSLRYIFAVPATRLAIYIILLFIFTGCLAWTALRMAPVVYPTRRGITAVILLGLAVTIGLVDLLEGTNSVIHSREPTTYNVATAPGLELVRSVAAMLFRNKPGYDFYAVQSATQQLALVAHGDRPESKQIAHEGVVQAPNFVLVLVESFGAFRDPVKQEWVSAAFRNGVIDSRFRTESGFVPFKGATVSGEFRELCRISAGVSDYPSEDTLLRSCLPNRLKVLGYETTAIHGFSGSMFDRVNMYPKLGFSHSIFHEQLSRSRGFHDCEGAFRGTCDADIARLIASLLNDTGEKKPQFIYWVTLDSHLPIARASANSSVCEAARLDPNICDWAVTLRNTLTEIAKTAATPGSRHTEFVVVGDHAPPFLFQKERKQFDNRTVPFIHLIPRNSVMRKLTPTPNYPPAALASTTTTVNQ